MAELCLVSILVWRRKGFLWRWTVISIFSDLRKRAGRKLSLLDNSISLRNKNWASLVTQWLRILLPMQETWVRALVREDPTYHGATKPVRHNYWARALEPVSHNYWARVPQLLKPAHLEPVLRNKRSHRSEKPAHRHKG